MYGDSVFPCVHIFPLLHTGSASSGSSPPPLLESPEPEPPLEPELASVVVGVSPLLLVCAPELAPSLPLPPASPQPRNSVKTGIRDKTRDHMR